MSVIDKSFNDYNCDYISDGYIKNNDCLTIVEKIRYYLIKMENYEKIEVLQYLIDDKPIKLAINNILNMKMYFYYQFIAYHNIEETCKNIEVCTNEQTFIKTMNSIIDNLKIKFNEKLINDNFVKILDQVKFNDIHFFEEKYVKILNGLEHVYNQWITIKIKIFKETLLIMTNFNLYFLKEIPECYKNNLYITYNDFKNIIHIFENYNFDEDCFVILDY
jgi:hypothetical protein